MCHFLFVVVWFSFVRFSLGVPPAAFPAGSCCPCQPVEVKRFLVSRPEGFREFWLTLVDCLLGPGPLALSGCFWGWCVTPGPLGPWLDDMEQCVLISDHNSFFYSAIQNRFRERKNTNTFLETLFYAGS